MLKGVVRTVKLRPESYVGVNGFMARSELKLVEAQAGISADQALIHAPPPSAVLNLYQGRYLYMGVLVSQKTLMRERPGNPNRYPNLGTVKKILSHHCKPGTRKLIHYNSRSNLISHELQALTEEIGPSNFDGFQLNIVWPDPHELQIYFRKPQHTGMRIIIQISGKAFNQVDRDPQKLCDRLARYVGLMTHVLFDMSGGTGKPLDPDESIPVLEALYESFEYLQGIGVAGGLGPGTVHRLKPLIERFPDLSFDAEGRLRNEDDALDLKKTLPFLGESWQVL